MQTISHRCDVQSFEKFDKSNKNKSGNEDDMADSYYLAGVHNAIEKTVQFATGVIKCD